jgi:hypothetical protein
VMLTQVSTDASNWKSKGGIHTYSDTSSLCRQIKRFAAKAVLNKVDLLVFPELSVPASLIKELRRSSKKGNMTIIGGSHYHRTSSGYFSRSPIIINGRVYFTEKINPSHFEKAAFPSNSLRNGSKIILFRNTNIGTFVVLICSDYLHHSLRSQILDKRPHILCVSAFQRESKDYQSQMHNDCKAATHGLYVIYANMLCDLKGDGMSAFFGYMERRYFDEFVTKEWTDGEHRTRLLKLREKYRYVIFECDTHLRRPILGHTQDSGPNVIFRTDGEISMQKESYKSKMTVEKRRSTKTKSVAKSALITEKSLREFVKSAEIISKIDRAVARATNRPVVYSDDFVSNFMPRIKFLKISSFYKLDRALKRERAFLTKFLTAFCDTKVAKTWSLTPSGMSISFLCYMQILHKMGVKQLKDFLCTYQFNKSFTSEQVADAISKAYDATVRIV